MNPIKVFMGNKRLKDIYPHATRWEVVKYRVGRFFRKVFIVSGTLAVLIGAFYLGGFLNPTTNIKAVEVIKEVKRQDIPAVMQRITACEAPKGHYENGQVLLRANKNGSVDVGKYQINSIWFKKASELQLDLSDEKDNETFALWLYENRGTEDWVWSKPCWQK